MNILIVSQYYYPEQFLINEIAPELVSRGHKVTVLTGLPNYPRGKVLKEYKFFKKRKETIDGVRVVRCFEIGRGDGKLGLLLNYMSFALSASLKALFIKKEYDVVFSYQLSPITSVIPAMLYKKRSKKKHLLYCLDIFPESMQSHMAKDGYAYKFLHSLSKKIYCSCDRIGVTSKPFIKYLRETNGVPTEKMVYLPQHADGSLLDIKSVSGEVARKNLLFAGNIGFAQSLDTLVDAIEISGVVDKILVHIVGDGSKLEGIKHLVKEKKLDSSFAFYGRQPKEKMRKYYEAADALILTLRGDNEVGNTMPGKLQTYMAAGKPILAAVNGAAAEVIRESGCGRCAVAGDRVGFAEVIKDFVNNTQDYASCGENARKYYSENFTLDKFVSGIEEIIEGITAEV